MELNTGKLTLRKYIERKGGEEKSKEDWTFGRK